MTEDGKRPLDTPEARDKPASSDNPELETLRDILFSHYRRQIADLEAEVDELERKVNDEDALIATITPVLGDAMRRKIRDAREEMVEALYPIIGQMVMRAVSEAIRDLARTLDAQVRTSFNPRVIWWRLRARMGGASDADLALRGLLPFEVTEIFLIHRESGLLLRYISSEPSASSDSDLISGMLTAIRDFAQDAFGRGQEGHLDEIQYGERSILIEAAQQVYLAVVVDGIEPPGFRAEMRQRVIEVNHTYETDLRDYDGDSTPFAATEPALISLMTVSEPHAMTPTQKRLLVGAMGLVFLCLLGACLGAMLVWGAARPTPTPEPVVFAPTSSATPTPTPTPIPTPTATATATVTPSATATATAPSTSTPSPTPSATNTLMPTRSPAPTATPAPTPTPTATSTAIPSATTTPTPEPVTALMIGNVWVHLEPAGDSPRIGVVLAEGEPVGILSVFDNWYQVLWTSESLAEIKGWVPAEWVEPSITIPTRMITSTPGP